MGEESLFLPPGFRFHPTDEEIIRHYLAEKVADRSFSAVAMGEADLNRCEPWDLPKMAKMGEKAWYFFFQQDRKYPTGMRTNRATGAGYWKATGKDKEIYEARGKALVGMRKTLVFYMGRAPKGEKTNWVMHEFRLEGNTHYHSLPQDSKESWVVCRVFHKNEGIRKPTVIGPPIVITSMEAPVGQLPNINPNQELPSYFFSQIPPNPFFSRAGSAGSGYLLREAATASMLTASISYTAGPYGAEHATNSTASRSTGTCKEWHSDISSYNADSPSDGPLLDLDNIWKF